MAASSGSPSDHARGHRLRRHRTIDHTDGVHPGAEDQPRQRDRPTGLSGHSGTIAARITGVKPYYRPDDKQGPTCLWYREGDLSRRALMVAVDAPGYSGWIGLLPKPVNEITVAGTAGVTSGDPSHCTLVVDLDGHALNVELIGLDDIDCAQTRTITEQTFASQS